MKLTVLILSAKPYSITENGRTNEGVSLSYIEEGQALDLPDNKGLDVFKETAPLAQWNAIKDVPGYYEVQMGRKSKNDARGKAHSTLFPEFLTFLRGMPLFPVPVK